MNTKVISAIKKYGLVQNGDKIIVALSGGADSVTLLDILNSIKEEYGLTLYAAHLNHRLRAEESERDENFCKMLCKKYNIELFTKSEDIASLAKLQKISEELCGRNERYKFFAQLSQPIGAKVATAHTSSDNAETLIYNVARGASIRGLSAITPKRGNIIRPLIECTRSEVEDYCKAHSLEYVTDSTNLSDDYTRNVIRHRVIPPLREINPQLEQTVFRLSQNARELAAYLDRQSSELLSRSKCEFGYSCNKLLDSEPVVLKNALALLCSEIDGYTLESKHIDLMLGIIKNGGAVALTGSAKAISKQGIFRMAELNGQNFFSQIKLEENLQFEYDGKIYKVSRSKSDKKNSDSVSIDLLSENAVFRTRKEGDKFTYPRRKITKPLRKVLNELKIPSEYRDRLLVLAVDSTVLWCEKTGVSLKAKNNSVTELNIEVTEI